MARGYRHERMKRALKICAPTVDLRVHGAHSSRFAEHHPARRRTCRDETGRGHRRTRSGTIAL